MKRFKCWLVIWVLAAMLLLTTVGNGMFAAIPALDTTGTLYLVSEYQSGPDSYQLYLFYEKGLSSGGFSDWDYLSAKLYRNNNTNVSLFPASLGGKVQMPLDSLGGSPSHPVPFQERWDSFVSRIINEIDKLGIDVNTASVETDMEMAWRYVFERLFLAEVNGKLTIIEQ